MLGKVWFKVVYGKYIFNFGVFGFWGYLIEKLKISRIISKKEKLRRTHYMPYVVSKVNTFGLDYSLNPIIN